MRRRIGLMTGVLLAAVCGGLAQELAPLSPSQIAPVVARDLGWKLQGSATPLHIQVLTPGLRLPPGAQLHVAAVHSPGITGSWLLRMECSTRVACLPFEVALLGRGPESSSVGVTLPRAGAGAGRSLAPPVVRPGQRVQLEEEVSGMRLSASAICLQAGSAGQKIRVRNVSSRRVVLARVLAAGEVVVEE